MSVLFDRGARTLLRRAYSRPGQWVGTRLVAPSAREVAYFAAQGINVLGTDQWGRDRWAAGFIRAVYYQHKWFYAQGSLREEKRVSANSARAVRYELGRRLPVLGILPAGRAVRVRVESGGGKAMAAVKRLPDSRRIYDDGGNPAGRFAYVGDRDW